MKTHLLVIAASIGGATIGVVLATGSANVGACSQQVQDLQKTLASKDAGMGPVQSGKEGTSPAMPAVPKAGDVPQTEATAMMNKELQGRAASPEDVQRQNQGQSTAAEAGQAGQAPANPPMSDAMASLQRARDLDKAGDEAGCMAAI